jgi:hypothetical protein
MSTPVHISYGVEKEDGTKDKRINDSIQGAQQAHDFVEPPVHTPEAGPITVGTVDCERLDDEDTDVDELRPPTVSSESVVVLPPLIEYAVR